MEVTGEDLPGDMQTGPPPLLRPFAEAATITNGGLVSPCPAQWQLTL